MKREHPPRSSNGLFPIRRAAACAAISLAPALARASEGKLELLPQLPALLAEPLGTPVGWALIQLLVLFCLLIAPANALVFKPLLRVLDERNTRIAGTRSRAEKLEKDAAAILLRYETSVRATREESERTRRTLLAEVRQEVQRETAAARREAEQRIERARTEIASSLDSARTTLRSQAQELARQAASQVLGRAL